MGISRQIGLACQRMAAGTFVLSFSAGICLLNATNATAQQQRRAAAPAKAAAPATLPDDDITQAPAMPMPSLQKPRSKSPVVVGGNSKLKEGDIKEGDVIVEGTGKPGQITGETNPGNVLIQDAWAKSEKAKDEGDYSEIIAMCEEGLKHKPSKENLTYARRLCAWSYNRRGERFSELGNEEEAMKDYTAAIAFDNNHWRAIHNRGVSFATMSKINEAMQDFSRALQINPQYANTWFNRGELLTDQRNYGRAVTDYSEAIRLSPKEGEFYSRRGYAYSRFGRGREAMDDFSSALKLNPNDAGVRLHRAEMYLAGRDWARASTDYRDAIKLNPNLGPAYQGAAWIMATCPDERFRNAELALTAAQKAMELEGDKDPRYTETLAAAYANAGQYDSAVAMLTPLIAKLPANQKPAVQGRLELYKTDKPYRDGQVAQQVAPAPNRQPQQPPRTATRTAPDAR